MDIPSPSRQPTHEEVQAIERFREKGDELSVVEKLKNGIDGTKSYIVKAEDFDRFFEDLK